MKKETVQIIVKFLKVILMIEILMIFILLTMNYVGCTL